MRKFWIMLSMALGGLAGLGVFTFNYAEGFSYFSHSAETCNNCHVMNDFYNSWQKGSHHAAAVCVDCHMPENLINKLYTKAENGYRHSKGFTLMDFKEPIHITPRNLAIVQSNCVRCHEALVSNIVGTEATHKDGVQCVQCHKFVGHDR